MTPLPQLSLIPSAGPWLALTPEQVMERTGWSRRTFFRRRVELISRTVASGAVEYLEASIPQKSVIALVAPKPETLPLFANVPPSIERTTLPDPEAQAQAQKRLDILKPIIFYNDDPARYKALQLPDGRMVTSRERMIEYVATGAGQTPRTIKRWLARFRGGNFAALADRIRADKGQSRWFERYPKAKYVAAYLFLNQRQSVTFACEQIERMHAELDIPKDDLPSRETVRVFLGPERAVSPAMKTLARQGFGIYREQMSPYLKRAYGDMLANELWVGDHGQHDVEIQNDMFAEFPYGTPGRLYASTFVDYRSRKAWMTWAWNGSSRSLSATLMRGMVDTGEKPCGLLLDNGKDMKKGARGGVHAPRGTDAAYEGQRFNWWVDEYESLEKLGFFTRLGIPVFHCLPRHGQAKHVERFFRTVRLRFDSIHSTYTSGSPFTRPEQTEIAMMRHRRLLKAGRVGESTHPTASRFILGCLSWLNEYNNTPQQGEGMEGMSPNEVYDATRNPKARPAPEPEALVELMGERVRRQVHECAVQINKHRYTPRNSDRMGWAAMHEANSGTTKREIIVAYNPDEPEFAIALTLDGRFLAWLEAELLMRFAPDDPQTQRLIGESMEIRRGLEKAGSESLKLIEMNALANGAKSAEEMLYGRLQLPANTSTVITQRKPRLRPNKPAAAPMTSAQVARSLLED